MEDTQTKDGTLIEEMLRDAQKAEVPSDLKTHPVIHEGDAELPAPMIVREISNAGYVSIWDSRTYEKVPVLRYMLGDKLKIRRLDGSYRFTTKDPKKLPYRGAIKCLLHADQLERAHYDSLGLRTCKKENLTNLHQLKQHMMKKHKQEWASIEEERKEKERLEDRKLQQAILKSVAKSVAKKQ